MEHTYNRSRGVNAISVVGCLIAALIIFISCGGGHAVTTENGGETLEMRYSKHLIITEHPDFIEVTVKNPWDSLRMLARYFLVPTESTMPADLPHGTVIRTPVKNALVYSTVHAGLISELSAGDAIGGVCGAEYIKDSTLNLRLAKGTLIDCGNTQNPDIESVIKLRPDVIMLSPYENNEKYGKIAELGIPILLCADYLETSALGRAEWMRFYGLLFGCRDASEKMFEETESEYMRLKNLAMTSDYAPSVLFDQRYGQVWHVPGGQSTVGRLITDAGGRNPFGEYTTSGSVALAPEKVLADAHDADVWFVRYNQDKEKSLNELGRDASVNSQFKAYKEGNVYGCNTRYVDFFEETPFHPDRLLRDMIIVMHPGLLGADSIPTFYHRMR